MLTAQRKTVKLVGLVLWVLLVGCDSTPRAHNVTLAWDANKSGCITGYNLYRSEQSGLYPDQPINKELIPATPSPTYMDEDVPTGTTYYYVVKAVCGSEESTPSNEVQAYIEPNESDRSSRYAAP